MKRNFITDEGYNFIVSYAYCTGKGYNCAFVNEMIVHNIENFPSQDMKYVILIKEEDLIIFSCNEQIIKSVLVRFQWS